MQQKPTLLVLAAGMGSRYGGLKQLDAIGPSGETILEYSVYDAIRAGFGKVVFVIREHFAKEFQGKISFQFQDKIEVVYAYQELDTPIDGVVVETERTKPWGTSHAILVAADVINEPFAVVNADDFYGASSFQQMADFLMNEASENTYGMVGYVLKNTLSENGFVSRGVCQADANGFLSQINERTKIKREEDGTIFYIQNEQRHELPETSLVSMNLWGFHPSIFKEIKQSFFQFAAENKDNLTAEFFIPLVVQQLIDEQKIQLKIITSEEKWYGVTYREDKEDVAAALTDLAKKDIYPMSLWAN